MNAFLLMAPLFLIRFVLLGLLSREALRRAALFAPLAGGERLAYLFYQLSNGFLILYAFFLKVQPNALRLWLGALVYAAGVCVLAASTVDFAKPKPGGLNTNGLYRFSRNPMYLGYFLYFLGCVLLTRSRLLLLALAVFQISAHWIILSEERWCVQTFGEEYVRYSRKVRRYL